MKRTNLGGLDVHLAGGSDGDGGGSGPVIVLMHGFGAPGTDLLGLAEEIRAPAATRWVFPMAPHVLDPRAPALFAPRAWWLIDLVALQVAVMTRSYGELSERAPDGLTEARDRAEQLVAAIEAELGVSSSQIVLGGFSQGAMLATDLVLRSERRFAGLTIFSGTLLTRNEWTALAARCAGLPVFMSHGQADTVLPFELASELERILRDAGLAVDWVPFAGGHGIAPNVLRAFEDFLTRAVSAH